jgi:hypothetical protein
LEISKKERKRVCYTTLFLLFVIPVFLLLFLVHKAYTSKLAMLCPTKQVRTLHERLKIIEEVEKSPTEKRTDIAKCLGLAPSTLNSIVAKKRKIQEQIDKCGKSCKKRKMGRNLLSASLRASCWLDTSKHGHQVFLLMTTSYVKKPRR